MFLNLFDRMIERNVMLMMECNVCNVSSVFLNLFFDSWQPSTAVEQFGGTPSYNLQIDRRQVQKLAALLEHPG